MDLSNAAFFPASNLLDACDSAANDLIKPSPTTRDRCDQRGAGLGGTEQENYPERTGICPRLERHSSAKLSKWNAEIIFLRGFWPTCCSLSPKITNSPPTGALGMQNSPINDLIEDLFEQAARGAPELAN
jgi:hypothetical protein